MTGCTRAQVPTYAGLCDSWQGNSSSCPQKDRILWPCRVQRGRTSARFPVSGANNRVPVGSRADSVIGWGDVGRALSRSVGIDPPNQSNAMLPSLWPCLTKPLWIGAPGVFIPSCFDHWEI